MLLKMDRLLYVLLPSFIWLQTAFVKGSPVSLTVEGGVSLVGPICPEPGNTTLLCVGTDLGFLVWMYNDANNIHFFNTDDLPGTVPLSGHPAFISATLNEVTQAANPSFANFSSTLTVNLGELQSVTNIVCGDTRTDSVPVNVTLLQPTAPAIPNIISIVANYQSTDRLTTVSNIEVTWRKLVTVNCTTFLRYEVSVGTGLSQNITQADCGESLCMAKFNTPGVVVTDISLRAVNDFGTSGNATYPLEQTSAQYFTPEVNITDKCETTLRCVPGTSVSGSTTCSVRYTSDPTYMDLSDPVTGPLNVELQVQRLQPNTVYYFVFSVMVDERLIVNINLQESSGTCDVSEAGSIVAAIAVPIVIIICFIIITCTVIAVITCWTKKKMEHRHAESLSAIDYEHAPVECTAIAYEIELMVSVRSSSVIQRVDNTQEELPAVSVLLETKGSPTYMFPVQETGSGPDKVSEADNEHTDCDKWDSETECTGTSIQEKDVQDSLLNFRVPAPKLKKIAEYLHEIWLTLNWLPQNAKTPEEALKIWHAKEGNNATYGALLEKLESAGHSDIVNKICALSMMGVRFQCGSQCGFQRDSQRAPIIQRSRSAMSKFWDVVKFPELKVHFMNPYLKVPWNKPDPHTILAWAAEGWNKKNSRWPNIYEKPCSLEESHIRVKLQHSEQSETWSLVGTDALKYADKPTMYLCLNACSVDDQKSLVLHEFGHALGLEHEHQRSDVWEVLQKVCNEEGLKEISEYFTPTEESSAGAKFRPYDPDSIMHFWMNIDWLKQEYCDLDNVKEMTDLSPQERKVIEGVHKRDYRNGLLAREPSKGDFEALRQAYKLSTTL